MMRIFYEFILIEKRYKLFKIYKHYLLTNLYPTYNFNKANISLDNDKGIWTYKALKDIGTITTGSTPKGSKNDVFDDDGLLWVTANDLGEDKYITDTKRKLNKKVLKKSKIIEKDSIFVSCIGIIGKIAISTTQSACNQQINTITPYDDYDSQYLYYTLERYNKVLNRYASQSVTAILNKSEFSTIKIPTTTLDNQKSIAGILSTVDDKLDLLKRKRELTKKYKNMLFNNLLG